MSTELQVAKDFIQFLLDQVGADEEELVEWFLLEYRYGQERRAALGRVLSEREEE